MFNYKSQSNFKGILKTREARLFLIILFMIIVISLLQPRFLQISNFLSLSRSFSIEGIALIGMTMLLVSGNFDISVGSVMALSGIICAMLIAQEVTPILAVIICLGVGVSFGFINGLLITKYRINSFIATFGMLAFARGIAITLTDGKPARIADMNFTNFGTGSVFGFPLVLILLVAFIVFFDISMRKVRFFRQLYFTGSSETSAELTGINVDYMKIFVFVVMGALAALTGIVSSARLGGADPSAYIGIELKLIVAAVIGGCSLSGGEGTILGSMFALIILFLLNNAMTMLGVSMYWENFILGTFLIAVVLINILSVKKQKKGRTL